MQEKKEKIIATIKFEMLKNNYKREEIANALEVNPQTFTKKIREKTEFTLHELLILEKFLNIKIFE